MKRHKFQDAHLLVAGIHAQIPSEETSPLAGSAAIDRMGGFLPCKRTRPFYYFRPRQPPWLDLPKSVSHMRFVPEVLVCLLASQRDGLKHKPGSQEGPFPVGTAPENNLLSLITFSSWELRGDRPSALRCCRRVRPVLARCGPGVGRFAAILR